ncbi:zinc finger, CCHC-type containing protein, partial [Tanacetum coccineum]
YSLSRPRPDAVSKFQMSSLNRSRQRHFMLPTQSLRSGSWKLKAYDMIQELKTMFEEQAKQELFETVKAFLACKQEEDPEGQPQGAKGKDKRNNKLAYASNPKIPPSPKRDNPTKDSVCHHCKEVGHWRKNCSSYQAELKKRKNASMACTLGIFTIELYAFPNKTWVYDTGCDTHICNTLQGLRGSKKLKHRAKSLYMGNGMCSAVEAIGCFDLILPSGLIIVLDNCISVLKDNVFYFNAIPYDGIYEIDMHNLYPNISYAFNVSNKRVKYSLDSSYLWHCRLGHINKKLMDKL